MSRIADAVLSENIPCDIVAGAGKTAHSPISFPKPEGKAVQS